MKFHTEGGAPFPEPPGYLSIASFVKSNPGNNRHYLDQFKDDPWYGILVETDEKLERVVPGYNIAQIKEKFGGLRYYIGQGNCPVEVWGAGFSAAHKIVSEAERKVDEFEQARLGMAEASPMTNRSDDLIEEARGFTAGSNPDNARVGLINAEQFKVGDRVFVTNARVHHYTGTVIGILARRVRVEFPRGGYNDTAYIEDFYPRQLTKEAR